MIVHTIARSIRCGLSEMCRPQTDEYRRWVILAQILFQMCTALGVDVDLHGQRGVPLSDGREPLSIWEDWHDDC